MAAEQQIHDRRYCAPFLTGAHQCKRSADAYPMVSPAPQVIALGIGMNDEGKGLIDYKRVETDVKDDISLLG